MPDPNSPAPFKHWMLHEIHQQPATLRATLETYVDGDQFRDSACRPILDWLARVRNEIVIAASGSSRHAAMVAEILIEDLSGIAVDVEYASEYTYRFPGPGPHRALKHAAILVVSQSGETADTLAALRMASAAGQPTLAITNVAASTMATEASASFPTAAGRERAIPATKSFTAQLLNLYLLALLAAVSRDELSPAALAAHLEELAALPALIQAQLAGWHTAVAEIATRYRDASSFLFLGRGVHYPVAREAALKLKESAYLHAEGYPSGELKHGPNALVGEGIPLIMLATVDRQDPGSIERYDKVIHLMRDMHAQGARILAIGNTGDTTLPTLADDVISVEETREALLPIAEIIPLQLFACFMAIENGIDVDNPRNLVKAVTVE